MKIVEILREDAVKDLEKDLKNPYSYDAIDHMMTTIAKRHKITPKQLHDLFVKKHGKIPDDWIKTKKTVKENIEDLGNGAQKKTRPDGTYEIGDGSGVRLFSADGKLLKYISPTFGGFNQETDHATGNVTQRYSAGPLNTSQTKDKTGKVVKTSANYDMGTGKLDYEQEKGITSKSWTPRSSEIDPISQKDLYAMGNKEKEDRYNRAMAQTGSR